MTCSPRTGAAVERAFCADVLVLVSSYRPARVAANRTLPKTTVGFRVTAPESDVAMASVLVTDPIGKHSVALIFGSPVDTFEAAQRIIGALGQILQTPATARSVAWIVRMPAGRKE